MLKCASETLNLFIRPLKNNDFKEDAGRKNRVVRHCYIHDPGIQQEPYVDEILHVDLYRWTPIMGWDMRWYQCILSSKATTWESEKSQQNLRHHCPIL